MTLLVLVILGVMWAAVLLPPWLRSRSEHRPSDSIHSFRRHLSVLERSGPVAASVRTASGRPLASVPPRLTAPMSIRTARKRRRDILTGLAVVMGVTLLGGFAVEALRPLLVIHVVADVLFLSYVVLLNRSMRATVERDLKVRYLPARDEEQGQALLVLTRSAR